MNPNMTKIASLLEADAVAIEKLAAQVEAQEQELEDLRSKLAAYEHREQCQKLASLMVEKGLSHGQGYEELVSNLSAYPPEKIELMKEAAQMAGPNLYANYAAANPNPTPYGGSPGNVSASALDNWAVGG